MNIILFVLFAFACALADPKKENKEEGSIFKGLHLTAETFDKLVGKDKHVLVKFYAPCIAILCNFRVRTLPTYGSRVYRGDEPLGAVQ